MRSQGLPLNTIVLGAVAVLVLVVVAVAVIPAIGGISDATGGAGDVTDIDTCQQHCNMLGVFTQYAVDAGPNSQYCQSDCYDIVACEIGGETVNEANCNGECDSDGDCPTDLCCGTDCCATICCNDDCCDPGEECISNSCQVP